MPRRGENIFKRKDGRWDFFMVQFKYRKAVPLPDPDDKILGLNT